MKKSALGKGLSALIPDSYKNNQQQNTDFVEVNQKNGVAVAERDEKSQASGVIELSLSKITPNEDQPRLRFEEEALEELAESIRENGIIQPIIVKRLENGNYEIVCGERRFKAAERIGLLAIPALVKDVADEKLLELALIENIQRQDLNAIEEAEAFFKLFERGLSHEEIATKVGKNRTTIVNSIRLRKLPKEIIALVSERKLSEGHARSLLALPTDEYRIRLAKRIIEEGLSVRQTEDIVKKKAYQKRPAKRARKLDAQILDLERKLEEKIGSKVRIFAGKSKGRIEIRYFSLDDFDRILSVLQVTAD